MTERNDEDDPGTLEDPDRKAILARRNRFIAVALTGLSTALAGCEKNAPPTACLEPLVPESGTPEPCLNVAPAEEGGPNQPGDPDEPDEPDEGQPMPCLSPPAPDEPPPPVDPNPADADPTKHPRGGTPGPKKIDPTPQPCLEVVRPEPPPHACLMVVAPDGPSSDEPDR